MRGVVAGAAIGKLIQTFKIKSRQSSGVSCRDSGSLRSPPFQACTIDEAQSGDAVRRACTIIRAQRNAPNAAPSSPLSRKC